LSYQKLADLDFILNNTKYDNTVVDVRLLGFEKKMFHVRSATNILVDLYL
jgi:hypothetical protein